MHRFTTQSLLQLQAKITNRLATDQNLSRDQKNTFHTQLEEIAQELQHREFMG